MADKKEEHTAHSLASKIAKALLKVTPQKRGSKEKSQTRAKTTSQRQQ
jgi:hypothetical protein